jgi:Pvc16 N-terminal domain
MTTYQGIAVATQTLRQLAWEALHPTVPGANVTLERPEESPAAGRNEPRLNIYLIQVFVEPTMRNNDLPTRVANGAVMNPPSIPLVLRYLFSFFGAPPSSHLMLGAIEAAIHQTPALTPATIARAIEPYPELKGSALESQQPPVQIVMGSVSLDELSRFWSGFFHAPYTLSTVFDLSPVIVTSDLPATPLLPVARPVARSGQMPPALDPIAPVTYAPGAPVAVSGERVIAGLSAGLGGEWSTIRPAADGTLVFALPAGVRAGITPVQLGASAQLGAEAAAVPGSTPVALSIRPLVTHARVGRGGDSVQVTVAPEVEAGQRVQLDLFALDTTAAAPSRSVSVAVTAPAHTLTFPVPKLRSGHYLVRVSVDGVPSELQMVDGQYTKPVVHVK